MDNAAKESLDLAYQISQILGADLDRHTLALLIALCDRGVNPEALSALVRELSSRSAPAVTDPPANGNGSPAPAPPPPFGPSSNNSFRSSLR